MINPNDVNLIIFDMDGTIIPSLPADLAIDKTDWEYPKVMFLREK